jgi:hypothetical protein
MIISIDFSFDSGRSDLTPDGIAGGRFTAAATFDVLPAI